MTTTVRISTTRAVGQCLAVLLLAAATACQPAAERGAAPDLLVVDRRPHPQHGLVRIQGDAVQQLFQADPLGHVMQFDLAADPVSGSTRGVLAYVAPPARPEATPAAGLYGFTLDETPLRLRPLLLPGPDESLLDPAYSADGSIIYFVRISQTLDARGLRRDISVEALDPAAGASRPLTRNAIWPTPSPDGRLLALVTVDPASLARGLAVLDLPSGRLRRLLPDGRFPDVDAPVFGPGGTWLYFFASGETRTSLLDLLGSAAHAHSNQPGLWWRLRTDGSGLETVTGEPEIISHGAIIGDGRMVYSSSAGLRVLDADGAAYTLDPAPYYGALAEWRP